MRPEILKGKGAYLYVVSYVEGANPNIVLPADHPERLVHAERIAQAAVDAGLTHVLIKVADGALPFNVRRRREDGVMIYMSTLPDAVDDCKLVVAALKRRGVQVWGWQYIYGVQPDLEADVALRRIAELGLDGFVVNAEKQFKAAGAAVSAQRYMARLRAGTRVPVGFSSYKFPTLHRPLPFEVFLEYSDVNMPQVYPIGDTRPNAHTIQLERSLREYRAIRSDIPIVPTGGAFSESYTISGKTYPWVATPAQVLDFFAACASEGLAAGNIWEWSHARHRFPRLWEALDSAWPPILVFEPVGAGEASPLPVRDGWMERVRELMPRPR